MLTRLFKVIHWIGTLMLLYAVLVFPVAFGVSVLDELSYTPPTERELKGSYTDHIADLKLLEEAQKRVNGWRDRTFFERMPDADPDDLWPETEIYLFDYKLAYPQVAVLAYILGVIIAYIGTGRLTLLPWRIR